MSNSARRVRLVPAGLALVLAAQIVWSGPAKAADADAVELVKEARVAMDARHFDDAVALCDRARQLDSHFPDPLTCMAEAYVQESQNDLAALIYQRIIDVFPDSPNAADARLQLQKIAGAGQAPQAAPQAADNPVQDWQFTVNGLHPRPIATQLSPQGRVLSVADLMAGLQGSLTWDMDGDQAQANSLGKAVDLVPGNDFVYLNATKTSLKYKIVQAGTVLFLTPRDIIALWGVKFKPDENNHAFDVLAPGLPDPNDANPKTKWTPAILAAPVRLVSGPEGDVLCASVSEIARLAGLQFKGDQNHAEITGDTIDVIVTKGSQTATENGHPVNFGIPAFSSGTLLYAPVDPFGTALGLDVSIDPLTHSARLGTTNLHVVLTLPPPAAP